MRVVQMPAITLHLGAHRTGASTLQHLMQDNAAVLAKGDCAVWTPRDTRAGLMVGLLGDVGRRPGLKSNRAGAKVAMRRAALARGGVSRLVISDQSMLGGLRENLLMARLYPSASGRMTRLAQAIPGIDNIFLAIRSPDAWWTSALSSQLMRGFAHPDEMTIEAIVKARRGWRNVIEDIAAALPQARLTVWTHEELAARPEGGFALLTGTNPAAPAPQALNTSPGLRVLRARMRDEGCVTEIPGVGDSYAPFSPDQRAALRAAYAQDLAWLRAGADGLATFATKRPGEAAAARDRKGMLHVRS